MKKFAKNLQTLNNTKQAIKTAIENKGQDLDDVPFTAYAEKIETIQSGSNDRTVVDLLIAKEAGGKKALSYVFFGDTRLTGDMLAEILNKAGNPQFNGGADGAFQHCKELDYLPPLDVSGSSLSSMFNNCTKLKTVMALNTTGSTGAYNMFNACRALENVPLMDTSKMQSMHYMFYNCSSLKTIPALDMRSATRNEYFLIGASRLTEVWVRNIGINFQAGKGTQYGHLLTQESALHLCKECRTVASKQTLTFATPVYDNLETLYVKLVPITEEMRVEDDLIDEKLPFELCESTDEGAMTIANYMTLKNWSIAK